jgi:hypothetical protein
MAAAAAAGGEWCGVGFKWGIEERWTGMGGFLLVDNGLGSIG